MSGPKAPPGGEGASPENRGEARGDDRFVAHLANAGELVAAGRFREAEVEVLRALSGLPSELRALNLLALVRFKLGRFDEARATYREIATAAPNDAAARRNLGLLALKLERIEEAIPELEMAARLAPADQQAWSYLGYAYAKKGEAVAAAAAFRRAGQDALAAELENAAIVRRPPSGPSLATLQPVGSGTPPPAAPVLGVAPPVAVAPRPSAAAPAPARSLAAPPAQRSTRRSPSAELMAPGAPRLAVVPLTGASVNVASAYGPQAFTEVEPGSPVEVVPVPLLGFVLSRLGLGPAVPEPRGEALRLGVSDEVHVRAGAALAAVGVRWEPAFRRVQGRRSDVPLNVGGAPFFRLVGPGEVWVAGEPGRWQAVSLEDDILYVREDRVLAFDGGVSWEAGAVPGDGLRLLQFRGRGCVVLRLDAPPVAVKVTEDRPASVARTRLLGWVGRLVTHKQRAPGSSPFELACQGEGVMLFDLAGAEPDRQRSTAVERRRPHPNPTPAVPPSGGP